MQGMMIDRINKSFGDNHVLKDITMSIEDGEFVSVLGPSGCGKTTLLKLIAGLETPESGSIYIGEVLCNNVPARKRGAVIVFQDYGLFPHMTVKQNIEFGLIAKKISRTERDRIIAQMLDVMQIEDKVSFYPRQLSGGQKQRVALARACALKPNVLLLDEPFSNLDTSLKDVMREFVSNMQRELGITTILVTHDKEESFMLSNRVAVVLDGKLQQFDTPQQIYSRPLSMQVAEFIGEANHIEGTVRSGVFTCFLGAFSADEFCGDEARLMLKYDQLRLTRAEGTACKVLEKRYKGHTTAYRVEAKDELRTQLVVNSSDNSFEIGQAAYIIAADGAGHIVACDT